MKNVILFFTFILMLCFSSCAEEKAKPETQDGVDLLLQGEHQLRKMGTLIGTNSKESRDFFLVSYSERKETNTVTQIKFAWRMNDGQYAISSLPVEKFRVKLDGKATTPTIKFCWCPNSGINSSLIQRIMDEKIVYALITIREEDWPVDINLPMN